MWQRASVHNKGTSAGLPEQAGEIPPQTLCSRPQPGWEPSEEASGKLHLLPWVPAWRYHSPPLPQSCQDSRGCPPLAEDCSKRGRGCNQNYTGTTGLNQGVWANQEVLWRCGQPPEPGWRLALGMRLSTDASSWISYFGVADPLATSLPWQILLAPVPSSCVANLQCSVQFGCSGASDSLQPRGLRMRQASLSITLSALGGF